MAEMKRYRIESIFVNVRGDGNAVVKKPNRRTEMVILKKTEVDLLKKYFQVEDWRELSGKVFTFDGNIVTYEKATILFLKDYAEELKKQSQQN